MQCPRCHEELVTKGYKQISVLACSRCEGILLEPSQLDEILAKHEDYTPDELKSALAEAHPGIPDQESQSVLACPVCATNMNKVNYDYSSGIIIDSCPNGDALWFDKNEISKVEIFMEYWQDKETKDKSTYLNLLKQTRETQVDDATPKDKKK